MFNDMLSERYAIIKLIGSGGMADVYLAMDTLLKREVAIKVLRGDLANDEENLDRFKKEALAISNTSHPNIVEIYDVGEDEGKHYIVMEYVHGYTLKQLIRQRGPIPTEEAVNIMKQLVSAVSHAHKVGIIHRDIKTQNVLIKDDGTIKLSDFGIAYTNDNTQLTQKETIMGSVHYLAPELTSGQICTPQSDIYSLGIVFYELLTGDVPYHGKNAVEIALKHLHNDVPSVRSFDSSIIQSVENIVIKATARKKELRYKNADDMFNDLVTCLDLSRNNEKKYDIHNPDIDYAYVNKSSKYKKKNSIIPNVIMIVLVVVLAAILTLFIIKLSGNQPTTDTVEVPYVIGYSLEEGKDSILTAGLKFDKIIYQISDEYEAGQIIRLTKDYGDKVNRGTYVDIIVSEGSIFTIEDYTGKDIESIKNFLELNGFTVIVSEKKSKERENNSIISQTVKEGTQFKPNDNKIISFTVSVYPTDYIPTDIIGMFYTSAQDALNLLDFDYEIVEMDPLENISEYDINGDPVYIIEPYTIVSCSPDPGSLYTQDKETKVTLFYYPSVESY